MSITFKLQVRNAGYAITEERLRTQMCIVHHESEGAFQSIQAKEMSVGNGFIHFRECRRREARRRHRRAAAAAKKCDEIVYE